SMQEHYQGKEKREFFRYKHEKPVYYKNVGVPSKGGKAAKSLEAISKNLSTSGLLFTTELVPELSSIVVIEIDYRTSQICREIEAKALMLGNKLIGKVVRIEEAGEGFYDIGVAFIKKSESIPPELKSMIQ
ncbi:MAG: PilZ domain-containing protein, partial [Candidatus Omnitrophica bacterium]|nr:PilZ domain-containing protein [Candidatus Omnitrophota bacterium]